MSDVTASYHEVSNSETELIHQQQREVDHLSAFLRAVSRGERKGEDDFPVIIQ